MRGEPIHIGFVPFDPQRIVVAAPHHLEIELAARHVDVINLWRTLKALSAKLPAYTSVDAYIRDDKLTAGIELPVEGNRFTTDELELIYDTVEPAFYGSAKASINIVDQPTPARVAEVVFEVTSPYPGNWKQRLEILPKVSVVSLTHRNQPGQFTLAFTLGGITADEVAPMVKRIAGALGLELSLGPLLAVGVTASTQEVRA